MKDSESYGCKAGTHSEHSGSQAGAWEPDIEKVFSSSCSQAPTWEQDIACVIFAGGKSSRMGVDKALLPFGSCPTLTEFQLNKFSPYFKSIYISCKNRDKFNFEANFIEDLNKFEDFAPYVGLISVFEKIGSEKIFVLSVDVPFFDIKHFKKLYNSLEDHEAVIAKSPNGTQPLCAIYTKKILPILKKLANQKRYRFAYLFEKIDVKFVEFEDEKIFTNLNTPQEYEKAIQTL